MQKFRLYPSLLSADLARLGEQAQGVLEAGADGLHIDVMDNHYVPNLTFGPWICHALKKYGINAFLDVHLMVEPVDELISSFIEAGATAISFHPEASRHVSRSLQLIKDFGVKAGLALNPATSLDCLDYVLQQLDFIVIMSVNPGYSGQKFINNTYQKLTALQTKLGSRKIEIIIDGGVCQDNIQTLTQHGVTTFIAGSAIFNDRPYAENIHRLKQACLT